MPATVIREATLIDGTGADPVQGAAVVVDDGRITAAGRDVRAPSGADVIDAGGRTVMPGLIDCHVHLLFHMQTMQERALTPPSLRLFMAAKHARATLDAGVTTVRDASGASLGLKLASAG